MNYKLLLSEAANADIAKAIRYYETIQKKLSIDFELCLEEGYAAILQAPLAYQLRYKEVHIKYIKRFPFGIHYIVEEDHIYILAVLHTSKNPKSWIGRLE